MRTASVQTVDVLVAGGGAAGVAAALSAARLGASVCLVEQHQTLGGTGTWGGVTGWEAGVGGTGVPFDLYRRLWRDRNAVGIYTAARHCCWPDEGVYPGGESLIDPHASYVDTLVRNADGAVSLRDGPAVVRRRWHGVVYEADAMAAAMAASLAETGRAQVRTGTAVRGVEREGPMVGAVELADGTSVRAAVVIDATGDATVCGMAGCERLIGQDPHSRFDEPGAPAEADCRINGVSLVFRVTPCEPPAVEPLPPGIPSGCWWRPDFNVAHVVQYPCGDLNVNVLPTMEGHEFLDLGSGAAYRECRRRIHAFWHHWQERFHEWRGYRISWIAPVLGIRETYRTIAEHMLTQHDLEAGLDRQQHDDIIAIADHPMDVHGAHGSGCRGVEAAYGVPFRCLIPRGMSNVLVACRGAGFSSLAASSCRLTRTMMQLGQAAGTAAALAVARRLEPRHLAPGELRECLIQQHVALTHPLPDSIRDYLVRHDPAHVQEHPKLACKTRSNPT